MKTAIVAGTTGLIGSQLIELLLQDIYYDRVIALSRKPFQISNFEFSVGGFQNLVVDFDKLHQFSDQLKGDDVFCCLGTTIKVAGSREVFYKVDHDYPVSLGSLTRSHGASQFIIVTASGANKNSLIFYNRVKGEVQEDLLKLGFESMHILQPSLLVGPRIEKRSGEKIIQSVMQGLGFLIPKKFKAIESIKVARAMLAIAKLQQKGTKIHDSAKLQDY